MDVTGGTSIIGDYIYFLWQGGSCMLKRQKAQGIVEFAVVLPLFLLISMGIVYFGLAFSDYLTMSNTVRSVAHEASMKKTDDEYTAVIKNCSSGVVLVSDIYTWEPVKDDKVNTSYLNVKYNAATKNVDVTAEAKFNPDSSIANAVTNILGKKIGSGMQIKYSMYSDVRAKAEAAGS